MLRNSPPGLADPRVGASTVCRGLKPKLVEQLDHQIVKRSIKKKRKSCNSALTSPLSASSWLKLLLLYDI